MSPPTQSKARTNDARLAAALHWAASVLGEPPGEPAPVSGDASFRRYFRILTRRGPLILMDAPPGQEDSHPFLDVANRLLEAGLGAPRIEHFDLKQGFGLVEDLGDRLYRDALSPRTAGRLIPGLLDLLGRMASDVDHSGLPAYDHSLLQTELDLFTDWYLARHRKAGLADSEQAAWRSACSVLLAAAADQPRVFVHRDFHSCNLLLRRNSQPGIIDFQDAVSGPVAYDFASLVWDRYIPWPRPRIEGWMEDMRQRLGTGGLPLSATEWTRWVDLTGIQRNLKIVGIFARLHYRDRRAGYLEMIPRFYQYLLDVVPAYPELSGLARLLEKTECAP
ncbi:aminoglycoside phosphotransferase family protein [Elongatibacter sediminis]|uniref:Phosphotransferase n=1 Tax=Elongatibacter sediminis TaxID=3119006 RepID=A0AAW9RHL8_9GAMM